MRQGLLPSQQRELRKAFKKADKFDHFRRRTRRAFLALGAFGIGAGVGGFVLGRFYGWGVGEPANETRQRWFAKLPWAQAYAEQPIAALAANHSTFLMVVQQTGGDERTWRGVARLFEHALSPAGAQDQRLRRMLLRTCELAPPPDWLLPSLDRLLRQ